MPASTASGGITNRKCRRPVKAGPCAITWQASGKITVIERKAMSRRCGGAELVRSGGSTDSIATMAPHSVSSGRRISM